jgi:hypothetical protein
MGSPGGFGTYAGAMGRIHSTFPSAVNVLVTTRDADRRLVTFVPDPSPAVPDGFALRQDDFVALRACRAGAEVRLGELALEANGLRIPASACRWHDDVLSWGTAKAPATVIDAVRLTAEMAADGGGCGLDSLPPGKAKQVVSRLRDTAGAFKRGDSRTAGAGIHGVAGCGIGLTPSADDALVGIIAMFQGARRYATGREGPLASGLRWTEILPVRDVGPLADLLRGRTTDVSMKYLICAQEGRFSAPLLALLSGVFADPDPGIADLLSAVAACGSSSGMDTILGIGIACGALLVERPSLALDQTPLVRI